MSEKLKQVVKNKLCKTWAESTYEDRLKKKNVYGISITSTYIGGRGMGIKNPSINFQKSLIRESKYDCWVVFMCPDWQNFDEEFEQEILDNLMIKDIIE